MYLYKLGYGSYEDSCYVELSHEKKFNKKQFELIIFECVDLAIQKKRKDKYQFLLHTFADVMDYVSDCMVSKFGFKCIEYEQDWYCWGWASIFPGIRGWKHEVGSETRRLRKYLKGKGYTKEDDGMYQMDKKSKEEYKKEKKKEKT